MKSLIRSMLIPKVASFSFATICKTHKPQYGGIGGSQPFSDYGTSDNYRHFNTSEPLYTPSHWRNSGLTRLASIDKLADWLIKEWFISKRRGEDWHHHDSDVWIRWISEPVCWRKFGREVTQPSSYDLTVDLTDLRPQKDPSGPCFPRYFDKVLNTLLVVWFAATWSFQQTLLCDSFFSLPGKQTFPAVQVPTMIRA